jgi:phosphoribosylanthranilate isomerase
MQIKICGVTNVEDAKACVELGAQMIGLNFYPRSPRYIEPTVARQIVQAIRPGVQAVGVFVDANADEVRDAANIAGIRSVQLHGNFSPDMGRELTREFRVIRAFSTHAHFGPEEVASFPDCDVLVDAHHPDLRGGTGRTCDWPTARATLPFARFLILSGGLNAQNVGQAITAVTPHAKDCRAIQSFIAAVRMADAAVNVSHS